VTDRNFDELSKRFARNIYDSPKGQIRLQLVQEELLAVCPQLSAGKPLRILDAGCGMGQMTVLLSSLGHEVVCCDLSETMLAETKALIYKKHPGQLPNIRFIHSSVQDLAKLLDGSFDVIVFHAVLEWMAYPQQGLDLLLPWLKPQGTLSLMFYNIHSLIFKNLLRGNFSKIDEEAYRGDPGSLTPLNPLDPANVEQWLLAAGLNIYAKRGIRTFYDFMDETMRHKKLSVAIDDVIRMEKKYGVIEPYRSLGRYQLWHCKKLN